MLFRNTQTSYGSVTKFLHWLIFILLAVMLLLGYFLADVPKDYQPGTYNLHKLIGLTILALMLFRGLWTLSNPIPSLPADTKPLQKFAEITVRILLYISVICMPLAGWIGSCAASRPPHLGSFNLNLPVAASEPLSITMFDLHGTFALMIIVLASIHILAALYHHFIKHDDILRRMMP